jgi:hypothetical protein
MVRSVAVEGVIVVAVVVASVNVVNAQRALLMQLQLQQLIHPHS